MTTTFAGSFPDKCGFGCKLKKFANKTVSDHRTKKAASYGFDSYSEWQSAAAKAKKSGQKKKGQLRLKELEKEYSGLGTGKSKATGAWAAFDSVMGVAPKRKAPKRRAAPKRAAPKRKAPKRKAENVWDFGF